MNPDTVREQTRNIIHRSEVAAVARALRSGHRLYVGQAIDYEIEPLGSPSGFLKTNSSKCARGEQPYRAAIEQWHLNEARRMLEEI